MLNVFISYAHEDQEFATWLADCLRMASFDPWLDEERTGSGEVLPALQRAIDRSDCGLFLISRDWLTSKWTKKESQLFWLRERQVPCIPLQLVPRKEIEKDLPPELSDVFGIDWIEGKTEPAAALWKLRCVLLGEEAGPRAKWAEQGRTLLLDRKALVPVTDRRGPVEVRAAGNEMLLCDRATEWNQVEAAYPELRHDLFLIAGSREEAHKLFVFRIEKRLRNEPPHTRLPISWPKRPKARLEYRERIGNALGCERDADLPHKLREVMAERNLILIHDAIEDNYSDPKLVSYYDEWLPELLAEARPSMKLKCIQPVVWDVDAGVAAAARRWLGLTGGAEKQARALLLSMSEVSAEASDAPRMTPAQVIELRPITENDVEKFCAAQRLSGDQRTKLLTRIRAKQRVSSRMILDEIDEFMTALRT